MMIKFNSAESFNLLDQLEADQQPLWGKMTSQHMVEHLTMTIKVSVGKIPVPLITKEEDIPKRKAFLMSDHPFPKNFKGVIPSDELLPLRYKTIEEAKSSLKDAIAEFGEYHRINTGKSIIHPVFGHLDHKEWEHFHNKHFTHHYRQFNLIAEEN